MLTRLVKKKEKERERGTRAEPSAQSSRPLARPEPSREPLSLPRKREGKKKPGGVPPEGDEPTGHKDESQ